MALRPLKLCFVTGSRADYGLLRPLILRCRSDPAFTSSVIATGSHLAPEHGLTVTAIEADGIPVSQKVNMQLSSDQPVAVVRSMGMEMAGMAEALVALQPDLLVVLGDRYEILVAVTAALIFRVPVAHIHGGELTAGAFDDAIRHAITKLSHLHFTATQACANRVIQMGESPERVFTVGALGLDNIRSIELLPRAVLEDNLGVRFRQRNLLITFHPATLAGDSADTQFRELLTALDAFPEALLLFSRANADPGSQSINQVLDAYLDAHADRAVAFASLGQQRYLSLMRLVDVVVGNSSSGIIEAPALCVPTVNIGDRQEGRERAASIIDCQPSSANIVQALNTALSADFRRRLAGTTHPYGDGHTAHRIANLLCGIQLAGLERKSFYHPSS